MRSTLARIALATSAILMAIAAQASTAVAQRGYVSLRGSGSVGSFDTNVNAIDVTTLGFNDPTNNVTSLDGASVFVDDVDANRLRTVATATNTFTSLNIGNGLFGLAISPSGDRVYAGSFSGDTVAVIDVATRSVLTNYPVTDPFAVAVSPDGTRLYVSSGGANDVEILNAATGAAVGSINGIGAARDILATPDGTKLFVVDQAGGDIKVVSTTSSSVVQTIDGTAQAEQLAITPDGSRMYAAGLRANKVAVIDVPSNAEIGSIDIADPSGAAVSASGSTLYVSSGSTNTVQPFSTATNQPLGGFPALAGPDNISLVPGQAPTARVSATAAQPGSATTFDAGASSVTAATIARFDWDFGDGTTLADGGPRPTHAYAKSGSYSAAVTVTSSDGVSTQRVFNGTQVLRNGSDSARATVAVTVPSFGLTLSAKKTTRVNARKSLRARARVHLPVGVEAHAYVMAGKRKVKGIKPRAATVTLKTDRSKTLHFKLSKKSLRRLKARLRRGSKLRLKIEATTTVGGETAAAQSKLKLAKRKRR